MEKKTLALILAFALFYAMFGLFNFNEFGSPNNSQDFWFHYGIAKGIPQESSYWERFGEVNLHLDGYPKMFHSLFSIFSENELVFYLGAALLIVVLIPWLLFLVSRNWWSVAFYFGGVSLPHQFLYGATYPQALLMVYFLIYLLFRFRLNKPHWLLLVLLAVLSFFTHSRGLHLFGLIALLEVLVSFKALFFPAIGWLKQSATQGLQQIISLFLIQVPLPSLFFGLREKKEMFYNALIGASLLGSYYDLRISSIAQLLLCIFAGRGMGKLNKKVKFGVALFLMAQCTFYLLDFAWGTQKMIAWN